MRSFSCVQTAPVFPTVAYWHADKVCCLEDIDGYENGFECCFAFSLSAAILFVHVSLLGLYRYGGAGLAYGHGELGLFIFVGTGGTLFTMLELILVVGEEKHIGCEGTTDDR